MQASKGPAFITNFDLIVFSASGKVWLHLFLSDELGPLWRALLKMNVSGFATSTH